MMDTKNGVKPHNEKWEERTGGRSDFARTLSPTSRNAWRIIRKMPDGIIIFSHRPQQASALAFCGLFVFSCSSIPGPCTGNHKVWNRHLGHIITPLRAERLLLFPIRRCSTCRPYGFIQLSVFVLCNSIDRTDTAL